LERAADSATVEILLGIDSDDQATLDELPKLPTNVRAVILPPQGYKIALIEYYSKLARIATSDWLLVWNDDALMQTEGWDEIISALPPCIGNPHQVQDYLNAFPIVPRKWVEVVGHFGLNTHVDTWWQLIGTWTGTQRTVPVHIFHDRADFTGNNADTTYAEREYDIPNFYSPDAQALIARDAAVLRRWLKANTVNDVLVIVPSRSRPHHCAPFAEALDEHSTRSDVVFALDEDDPALAEYRPVQGVRYEINPPLGLVDKLNLIANKHADHYRYLAYLGDDYRVRTPSWDQRLIAAIEDLPAGMAYANDLLYGQGLPTAVLMKADIVRALGYMVPPELGRRGKNVFWRDLGGALHTLRYDRDVVVEHMNAAAGKAAEDAVYLEANTLEAIARDHSAYQGYARTSLDSDVARLADLSSPVNLSADFLSLVNAA